MAHLEVPMLQPRQDTDAPAPDPERAFALLRSGVPLTLLLDLAAPVHSRDLLRDERGDVSWVHAVA